MKKLLLTLSAVAGLSVLSQAQTTVYSENFDGTTATSLPTGWSQSGSDWKTGTSTDLNSQYFGVLGDDTRVLMINDDAAGQNAAPFANERVSTGSINLSAVSGSLLFAKFDMVYLPNSATQVAESFKFVASTDGGTTWTTLQSFEGVNSYALSTQYVDVSSYIGASNVKFGWVYDDGGDWSYGAAIDNFSIIVPLQHDLQLTALNPQTGTLPALGNVGDAKTFTGTVYNNSGNAVTSFHIKYQQGANPVVDYSVTGVNIAPFASYNFTDPQTFSIPSTGSFPVNVWVVLTGDQNTANDSAHTTIQAYPDQANWPTKRLVFEEATGTWCGWCPRGAVGMDELSNQFPGAATQIAVHNSDPMTVSAYDGYITSLPGFSGFPSIVIDRRQIVDPGDIIDSFNAQKDYFGFADITMGTPTVSGTSVTVPVTITPSVDIANAKLALVVTESNVRHADAANPPNSTDTVWMQHNYYSPNMSGGPNEGGTIQLPLTGFDHASEYVDGMYYHFVARGAFPSPAGDASGLPASMTAGTAYNATLTGTIDASWNQQNLQYSVLLMGGDGSILNSAASATPTLNPVLDDTVNAPDAISNIPAGINNMELYPNPASDNVSVSFDMKQATAMTLTIVDVTGKVVYTADNKLSAGNNIVGIPVNTLSNGNYFFTAHTQNGGTATIKFVVMH